MKTIGFEIDDGFPLKGKQLKEIAKNFAQILYLSKKRPKEYSIWINSLDNKELKENLDKLAKWSGIDELLRRYAKPETEETD